MKTIVILLCAILFVTTSGCLLAVYLWWDMFVREPIRKQMEEAERIKKAIEEEVKRRQIDEILEYCYSTADSEEEI